MVRIFGKVVAKKVRSFGNRGQVQQICYKQTWINLLRSAFPNGFLLKGEQIWEDRCDFLGLITAKVKKFGMSGKVRKFGIYVISYGTPPLKLWAVPISWGLPPLAPPQGGKSSPSDVLGNWPRKVATSPKLLSLLAFLTLSRVLFARP
jgi:hypothetical protein